MKVTFNPSIQKVTGKMDNWVYRQLDGQTIVSGRPERSRKKPKKSVAQTKQRDRFADAIAYAQDVLKDPLQREWYTAFARERGRRADRVLVSDYLTPPEIRRIDLGGYHGQPGDEIRVIAEDDVEVVALKVTIAVAGGGAKLEEGAAKREHGVWRYVATSAAPGGAALQITVAAMDRPEHITRATVPYPEATDV